MKRSLSKMNTNELRDLAVSLGADRKKLVFLYYDQEACGDRTYYYCEEDDTVYSNYFSIGD